MAKRSQSPSTAEVLAFPFHGSDWPGKLGIGLGLLFASFFVPLIPAIFVYGYLVKVMRGTIRSGSVSLPEWDDWAGLGADGLKAFGIGFTYLLPGLFILLFGICCYCASILSLTFQEASYQGGASDAYGLLLTIAMFAFFASLALGSFLSLLGAVPLPVAAGNLAQTSQFTAAFRFRQLWRVLAANPLGYFAAWVIFMGVLAIAYGLMTIAYYTLILACFIPFISLPLMLYAMLIGAAQFGLAYREGKASVPA
jgi:hypothetical protein